MEGASDRARVQLMRRAGLWFSMAFAVLLVVAIHARLLLPVASPAIVATGSLRAGLAPLVDGESRRGGLLLLESALDGIGAIADRKNHKNNVLLLDAGNSIFADNSSPQLADEFPQIMAQLGYDAMTLGYRDLAADQGPDRGVQHTWQDRNAEL